MPRTYVENNPRLGRCNCNLYTVALYWFELGTKKRNILPSVEPICEDFISLALLYVVSCVKINASIITIY